MFCQEYMVDRNGAQATIRAGYEPKAARVQASKMLTRHNIARRIAELEAVYLNKVGIDVERVLNELATIAFSRISDFVVLDENGLVITKPINEIPKGAEGAIKKVKARRITRDDNGPGVLVIDENEYETGDIS